MNLASLQERVRRHVQVDLAPLFDTFKVEKKSDDIDGFVSHLVKSGVIPATLVREIYSDTDVDVGPDASMALAGTLLSRKAGGTMVMGPPGGAGAASKTPAELSTMVGGFAEGDDAAPAAPQEEEVRYEPIARLGQGAMGAIDVARDVYLRRRVALKTVLPEMAAHKALLGRFFSEMQITAQLEHPNIVPVYALEVGADGTLGYAMKLVNGKDLSQLIEEARELTQAGKTLPPNLVLEQRLEVFLKVCDALEYAHAKGIVHRDLKPANVMVGKHNEVYLMDWGIARPMGSGGQAVDAGIEIIQPDGDVGLRTRVGSTIGTPTYMSPEQAAGKNQELDGRSDLYTMGLILQECVTLKQAVGGATLEEVLTKAREARRDPIEVGVKPGALPRELEAIVKKATSREVSARYASITALADDVRHYLRNEPISALPDDAMRRATRWISRNRTTSLAIMLSIALLGSVATIVTQRIGQSKVEAIFQSELRQSEFETESAIAAQLLDRKLARYEVALSQLAGAAQAALARPEASGLAFFADDFGKPGAGPPDLAPSKRYGAPVSLLAPAVAFGSGASREQVEPVARSLAGGLAPAFREALLDTASVHSHELSPDGAWAHIAGEGTPAMLAHVVLADGLTFTYPGSANVVAVEVTGDSAYLAAAKTTGFHWSKPITRGATSVLPVSTAIYAGAEYRGVAVLEIAMDRMLERRGQANLDYVQTRLLLARDGTVKGEENGEGGRAPLAKVVVDAVAEGKSGSVEYDEGGRRWMATYYSLTALDWSFVSIADMGRMLASQKVIVASDARAAVSAAATPPAVSVTAAAPPPAPPPPPPASASAEPEVSAAPSASAPPAPSLGPPWPKTSASAAAPPAAPPSAPPAASSAPRNPFDKWEEYKKK